jgi:hypothetical protein
MEAKAAFVKKWSSAFLCSLRQRITGEVKTISPIELNRMIRIFSRTKNKRR